VSRSRRRRREVVVIIWRHELTAEDIKSFQEDAKDSCLSADVFTKRAPKEVVDKADDFGIIKGVLWVSRKEALNG
jgi:hypothetical protein